jgi:hypothetical protein
VSIPLKTAATWDCELCFVTGHISSCTQTVVNLYNKRHLQTLFKKLFIVNTTNIHGIYYPQGWLQYG